MADAIFLTLLFVHVFAIVAWLGIALFGQTVLLPLFPRMTPGTRSDIMTLMGPRMLRFTVIAAGIAMVDGVILYVYINFVSTSLAPSTAGLQTIQLGAILALIAALVGTGYVNSLTKKVQQMQARMMPGPTQGAPPMSQGPPSSAQRIAQLQKRATVLSRVGTILLVFVLLFMVIGANI